MFGSAASKTRRLGLPVAGVIAAVAISACGSSSSSSSTASSGAKTTGAAATGQADNKPYNGIESKLPTSYPAPDKTDQKVTIGWACSACQSPAPAAWTKGMQSEASKLGINLIVKDAGGDVQKQINDFKQEIVQGAKAIILEPLDRNAMNSVYQLAKSKGVGVVTINSPGDTTQPLQNGVDTTTVMGFDEASYKRAQYLASVLPKGSQVAAIGYSVPNDGVMYNLARQKYWAEQFGMKFTTQVDISEFTPAAGQNAANSILSRYPNVKAIFQYEENSATGVATAIKLRNKKAYVGGWGWASVIAPFVAGGTAYDTWFDTGAMGAQTVTAAYDLATRQHLPLPKIVTTGNTSAVVTQQNSKQYKTIG